MRANDCPSEETPAWRYPCENEDCIRQAAWPPEELRRHWGGDDGHGTTWSPGFYCSACQNDAPRSGLDEGAPTLADELARQTDRRRAEAANLVEMRLVGTLICLPFDMPQSALLEVLLVDRDRRREHSSWHLAVGHDWPESECLPGDLVYVEGHLAVGAENDPDLMVSRVRLLRPDITGAQRRRLLELEDPVERWNRARMMSW